MFINNRYIPEGSVALNYPEVNAVVYVVPERLSARAYSGKRGKADFSYLFSSQEAMDKYIASWVEGLRASKKAKAVRATVRKDFKHTFKVGDILDSTWGYDQTNVDFYEVVEVLSDKTISIREIDSYLTADEAGFTSGYTMPTAGKYKSGRMTKRVSNHYIRLSSFQFASLWDGEPVLTTWGH